MTTFARLVGGYALDCQIVATAAELAARFHPDWLAANPFAVVPDGTVHGATENGDGTFTNPAPPSEPSPKPRILSKTAFQDFVWAQLGGSVNGMARFNQILKACAGGDDILQAIYDRYVAADTFAKDQVNALTTIMVQANVMSADEQKRVIVNWPQG